MRLAIELHQPFEHHGARGHIDTQSQCLRGEYGPHQTAHEQLFDGVPEGGQHTRVMRREATMQPLAPLPVTEHLEIATRQITGVLLDDRVDLRAILRTRQIEPRAHALGKRPIASRAAEDEGDGREQTLVIEFGDHLGPRHRPEESARPTAPAPAGHTEIVHPVGGFALFDEAHQILVDQHLLITGLGVEEVEHAPPDHDVLPQRHRPGLVHDDGGIAAHGLHPRAELLGVADRGGQTRQPHLGRQVQDDLFPHRTAEPVGQVVHLVHHHIRESLQRIGARVQHIAQHLGGHDHDGCVRIDGLVTGEQTHRFPAVARGEVGELLIRQRLDGCRVEAFAARGQGQMDRELADHRLTRTGGRADEHTVPALQRLTRRALEGVQLEFQLFGECRQFASKRP